MPSQRPGLHPALLGLLLLGALTTSAFAALPGASTPRTLPWQPASFDVPADEFRSTLGYVPAAAPGRPEVLLSPDGDCSTPTGPTRFDFEDACREHDLAYDLLRYSEARGEPVDRWSRWEADLRFGLRMTEQCTEHRVDLTSCLSTAGIYTAGVTLNSIRQLYGAPPEETVVEIAGSTLLMIAATALLLVPTGGARAFRRVLHVAELDLDPPPASSGWSGGNGSLVDWEDLGREGRRLLTRDPVTPGAVRVLVGLWSAGRVEDRVALALAEAERVGAFTRGTVCVATPTGSGWLNPAAVEGLERVTGGDVATLSVAYAAVPSWWCAAANTGAHHRTATALLRAVHDRWARLDPADRPRLVVLGESLGANATAHALRALPHAASDVAGGLLVGGVGSARWEPPGRVALVRHDDDPVVHLGPRTLHRLPGAGAAPEGRGHHYGAELEGAWLQNLGSARSEHTAPAGPAHQTSTPSGATVPP